MQLGLSASRPKRNLVEFRNNVRYVDHGQLQSDG